ncbi:hypothetical protein GCM10017687_77680 [Streptomyces echinatus]|uniref:hypothetical protein n=1 Tax=Streptomyces echinatus TaxID=67293 RepID=UPI0031EB7156
MPYVYQHSTYDSCRFGADYACTCQYPRHTGALSEAGRAPAPKPDQVMFDGLAQWSGTSFATPVARPRRRPDDGVPGARPAGGGRRPAGGHHGPAEVRGAHVPVLRPPTWRPVPAVVAAQPA